MMKKIHTMDRAECDEKEIAEHAAEFQAGNFWKGASISKWVTQEFVVNQDGT